MKIEQIYRINGMLKRHQIAKGKKKKPKTLLEALELIARDGIKIELTPREKAQFEMARAAELVAREAKFNIS